MRAYKITLPLVLVLLLAACGGAQVAPGAGLLTGRAAGALAPADAPLAEDPARIRTITTAGEAEVRVVPDEVILTLGVETWNEDLDKAREDNDAIMQKVLALTKKLGIQAKHVQTDYISVEPRYEDNYAKRDFIGFFVRKSIVITLRDTVKFEDLLTGALTAGVSHIHGIRFQTTELRKHRDEARSAAIKAAREKAEAMAGELGQKIGRPLSIREEYNGWRSGYGAWWGSRWSGSATQNVIQNAGGEAAWSEEGAMAPGQIAVSARVSVEFELE